MTNMSATSKMQDNHSYQPEISVPCEPHDFNALVSYELRTPLTSIRGALGLLLSGKLGTLPEQGQRLLEIAVNNTDRLVRLTAAIESDPELQPSQLTAAAMLRFQMEKDLRLALAHEEFKLCYQPIVCLDTEKIVGFEALVRWQHPQRGLVSPIEFIPVAEETGLIQALGLWVLRQACQQLHSWQQQFSSHPPLTMSVNLSSLQLCQPDLVMQVEQILQATKVAPGSLRLEITESALMENQATAIGTLNQLKALGIQLYIDDFGTGYSSLSRLHELPIDVMKIDRSFVHQKKWSIISAIMILASSLGLEVIAEGVETIEEQIQLEKLGCRYLQGYFYSQPVDSEAATKLLTPGVNKYPRLSDSKASSM